MSRDRPEPAHGHGHGHGSRPGQEPARSRRPASMIQRLWRALAAFILLLTGAGALIYFGLQRQDQTIHLVVRRLQPLEAANLRVRSDFSTSQAILQAYILTGETRLISYYESARRDFTAAVARAHGLATGSARSNIALQRLEAIRWYGYADKMQLLVPGSASLVRLANESFGSASTFYLANQALHDRLAAQTSVAISTGQRDLDTAVAWSAGLAGLALLLGLAAAAGTVRGITRPLAGLTGTMRRLSAGDHTARAGLMGAAETRQVALSLNELADESDRLRAEEGETGRLLAATRAGGIRIREHLHAPSIFHEAMTAIEDSLATDFVWVGPASGEELTLAGSEHVAPEQGAGMAGALPADSVAWIRDLFRQRSSYCPQDLRSATPEELLPEIKEVLLGMGAVSLLLIPFGIGTELVGIVTLLRNDPGHPWTGPEIEAVESLALDIGRALEHARLYEGEERLVEELQSLDRAKTGFLASATHDLRTPLTSIVGYVEMIQDGAAGPVTSEQVQMLGTVDRNVRRLENLIEDMLTISRIELGAFTSNLRPVDLARLVPESVDVARPLAVGGGLTLDVIAPDGGLVVDGDADQLDRVLMNLLTNAVKYTPSGGRVTLTATREGDDAMLVVQDTGIGIPEKEQESLFTPFFRASNAVDRVITGSGLGLSIVLTIIQHHHGELELKSAEGAGTTVTVRIPLLRDGTADLAGAREDGARPDRARPDTKSTAGALP